MAQPLFILADSDASDFFLPTIALIFLIGIFVGVVWYLRRNVKEVEDMQGIPPAGFTLGDLRDLHKSGKISDEEFARAKDKLLAESKKEAHVKPPASGMG